MSQFIALLIRTCIIMLLLTSCPLYVDICKGQCLAYMQRQPAQARAMRRQGPIIKWGAFRNDLRVSRLIRESVQARAMVLGFLKRLGHLPGSHYDDAEGSLIGGRYKVIHKLVKGAYATVSCPQPASDVSLRPTSACARRSRALCIAPSCNAEGCLAREGSVYHAHEHGTRGRRQTRRRRQRLKPTPLAAPPPQVYMVEGLDGRRFALKKTDIATMGEADR